MKKKQELLKDLKTAIKSGFQQKAEEWIEIEEIIESKKYTSILEIGNYDGDSLIYFASRFKKVFGLDIVAAKKKLPENVEQIIGNSKSSEVMENVSSTIIKGRRKGVDVLFIDGDHSFEGSEADFYNYRHLVKEGGMIIFHDILDSEYHRSVNCNVAKVWNKVKDDYNHMEFISKPLNWGGIGVLFV